MNTRLFVGALGGWVSGWVAMIIINHNQTEELISRERILVYRKEIVKKIKSFLYSYTKVDHLKPSHTYTVC